MKIKLKVKGGKGSGNWGHAGRPGSVGGSMPRSHSMSIRTGRDWKKRYEAKTGRKPPKGKVTGEPKKVEPIGEEKTPIPINVELRDKLRLDMAKKHNEHIASEAITELEESIAGKPIRINVEADVMLEYIIPDGRLKNQHETGTSRGELDNDWRRFAEANAFGNAMNAAEPEELPVYGWIESDITYNDAWRYGDVSIVLKDGVKDRATLTYGDSLSQFSESEAIAAPIRDLMGSYEILDDHIKSTGHLMETDYVEVQIFGGVKLSDIDYVDLEGIEYDIDDLLNALDNVGVPYKI